MSYNDPSGILDNRTPSHVQSAEADGFILGNELIRENPFLLPTYFKQSGNDLTTLMKIQVFFPGQLNTSRASDNPVTGHWEKPRWKKTFTVGTIIAGSNPGEAVVTLSADDMYTTTNDVGGSFPQSYPRVDFTVRFDPLGTQYRIIEKNTTVNPNTITIQSGKNGIDPTDEIAPGDVGVVGPSVHVEGSGQPKGLRPLRARYSNTFWITKETDIVTGSNLTTQAKIELVPGTRLIWVDGFRDMEHRHEYHKGEVWLMGQKADQGAWTDVSEVAEETFGIPGTEGLLEFISESGHTIGYDPNDVAIEDFYELSAYFQDISLGTREVLLIQGYNMYTKIEQSLGLRTNYEWVIGVSDKYISESMRKNWAEGLDREQDPHGAFLNLGILGFQLGGFTYMQTAAPELNDAYGYGAIGGKDLMIAAPWGLANVDGNDHRPYLGYEYRGAEGYSRENEMWMRSGAGNASLFRGWSNLTAKTSQYDGVWFFLRSEIAPHFSLGQQFVLYTPTGGSPS